MKKILPVLTALMLTACSAESSEVNVQTEVTIVTTTSASVVKETVTDFTETITETDLTTAPLIDAGEQIADNGEKIYTSEDDFPSFEDVLTAKEYAFTDTEIQDAIKMDMDDGIITAETADGLLFDKGIHADFDADGENESIIALKLPAHVMGGGAAIYVDHCKVVILYSGLGSGIELNAYTFNDKHCFSVTGAAGASYYFTSIFTVEDGIPQERLNYSSIEFENGIFKCIDKFDSEYTYYAFDSETGKFEQIAKTAEQ